MHLPLFIYVGVGGFAGAILRFLISSGIQRVAGSAFPYGTISVNTIGSFVIGFLFLYFEHSIEPSQKAMFVTGLLGALTTFSTFSLETLLMLQGGMYTKALANIAFNILLSIAATMLGMTIFKRLYGI